MAMLGDTHGPYNAHPTGPANGFGSIDQLLTSQARLGCGMFQRERRKRVTILLHSIDPALKEVVVGQIMLEHIARQRRSPDQVSSPLRPQKEIGPLGQRMLARIHHDQLLTTQLLRRLDAGSDHRMILGGITADDDNHFGLLKILNGARITTVTNGAKETRGGRVLTVAG